MANSWMCYSLHKPISVIFSWDKAGQASLSHSACWDDNSCVTMKFLVFLLFELASSSSDLDCFLDHQECEIHPDNLINTVTDVPTMEQCLALCQDEFTCVAFTHFGSQAYPLRESCVMFSSCSERRPCQGCTTGSSQSECLCSINYSSEIDSNNFVGMLSAVDEHDCKRKCIVEEMCKVWI